MAEITPCTLCGQPIRWVEFEGEALAIDAIAVFDGPYRLVGESQTAVERITRPGFYGHTDHATTCPKRS